jgi:hypothetical protein
VITALAAACMVALMACSSPSAKAPPRHTPTPTVAQHPLPAPSAIPNNVAQRRDVSLTGCLATHEGWAASGIASNPGSSPASYTITIFFTTTSATVLDYATTTVSLAAGQHDSWRAAAQFAAPAHVLCVLRGVG